MKKLTLLFVLTAFCLVLPGVSFAEEAGKKDPSMKHHKMMKKGGMKDMMMKKMMQKEMVATKDGGIILLVGNKLIKYDQDLNLIKEVEIKMDIEGQMKRMRECMDKMKEFHKDKTTE